MMLRRWSGIGLQATSIKAKPELRAVEYLLQEPCGREQLLLLQRWRDVCHVQRTGVGEQRAANSSDHPRQNPDTAGMVEKQNRRFGRKSPVREVHVHRLDIPALLSRRIVPPEVFFGGLVQFWRELQTHYPLKRELGREQQRASLPRTEIYERVVLKGNIDTCQDMFKLYRIDRGIVVPLNPVRAGDVEIAKIGPLSEPATRLNPILPVKLADGAFRTQRLGVTVLPEKMNRQEKAPAKAGYEAALPQRFLNSGNDRSPNSWHRTDSPLQEMSRLGKLVPRVIVGRCGSGCSNENGACAAQHSHLIVCRSSCADQCLPDYCVPDYGAAPLRTAAKNRFSLVASSLPSLRTPEQTSSPNGPTSSIAWPAFSGVSPPAKNSGIPMRSRIARLRVQS